MNHLEQPTRYSDIAKIALKSINREIRSHKNSKFYDPCSDWLHALNMGIRYCASCPWSDLYLDQNPPRPKEDIHLGCLLRINITNFLARSAITPGDIHCPKRPREHPYQDLLPH